MSNFLIWLDANPERYCWIVCAVFSIAAFYAFRPLLGNSGDRDRSTSDWRWGWVILAALLAGRWPTLFLDFELNCDESYLISGAHTLRYDPVFWRSVDTQTSGPLNSYALLPVGSILGRDTFLSARITALLLLACALLFVHQSAALFFGRTAARLAGLATLFFEALTIYPEFLYYSSELVSIALLAAAFYLGARTAVTKSAKNSVWFGTGLLLGTVPFAKLQGAPAAAFLWLAFLLQDAFSPRDATMPPRWKSWTALMAGSLFPVLFFSAMTLTTGVWRSAWISYFLNVFEYVDQGKLTTAQVAAGFIGLTNREGALIQPWWLTTACLVLALLPLKRTRLVATRWFLLGAGGFLLVSVFCVLTPHRAFPHYLQFIVFPWTLLVSAATGVLLQTREDRISAFARTAPALLICIPVAVVFYQGIKTTHPSLFGSNAFNAQSNAPLPQTLQRYTRPGESMAVWGWMPQYYVALGLPQATRDAVSNNLFIPNPNQSYFRRRYLEDLRRSLPPLFVDAARTNQNPRLREYLHADPDLDFVELTAFVREHYTQIQELDGSRIYVRNDRLP